MLKFFLVLFCLPFLLIAEEDDCAFVDHPLNRLDIERHLTALPAAHSPLNLTCLALPLENESVASPELTANEEVPPSDSNQL